MSCCCCRLHESTCALEQSVVDQLGAPLRAFSCCSGLNFTAYDQRHGSWRNYFVGIVGHVAAHEEDVLWPNQARWMLVVCDSTCPPCQLN